MAYAEVSRRRLAQALNYSDSSIDRLRDGRRTAQWEELWQIADTCGLPAEWFTAEIGRLFEIVPDGAPVFSDSARRHLLHLAQRRAQEAPRTSERSDTTHEATEGPDVREGSS